MPHGITQCYLPPGRGDIPALAKSASCSRQITMRAPHCLVTASNKTNNEIETMVRTVGVLAVVKTTLYK